MAASRSLPHKKKQLRSYYKDVLAHRPDTCDQRVNTRLFKLVMRQASHTKHPVIACTWPLIGEIDLRPLCHRLHNNGFDVVLPQTPKKGHPLIFRKWSPDKELLHGPYNTSYPDGDILTPSIVIVPLLAFDNEGHRLGYGGGYYDRTLASLGGCTTIGYASQKQRCDQLPVEKWDIPLSFIVTDVKIWSFEPNKMVEEGKVPT